MARRHALIDSMFKAVWVRALQVSEAAVVERIANEIGLPGGELIQQAQNPEIKTRFRE